MFIYPDCHRILVFSSEKHKRAAVRRKTWQRVLHSVRVGTILVSTRCSEFTFDCVGKTKTVLSTLHEFVLSSRTAYAIRQCTGYF